ncbi:MAG: aldose 1-epimerase [Solirubrobacteraceae bacterium]|jgi:aldose 1-epimerase|nr:aldose 1-epimerase [Solirubrobacteraceae bacterium]MEA2186763.1 aldose 1-epimerase [Solirubrobacteraceae bacterium]
MVELRTGDLTATWLPEHGMVGASLRHRGDELHGARDFGLRGAGRELRVALDTGITRSGTWAPEGEAFVAWEPMTAPTNALVSGRGLRHVAPGDSFAATFTVNGSATDGT